LPAGVELGWLSTLINEEENENVGLGNSRAITFCAVAASTPTAAASKSQFLSKAVCCACARVNFCTSTGAGFVASLANAPSVAERKQAIAFRLISILFLRCRHMYRWSFR